MKPRSTKIYFDNNATTPLLPEVKQAMLEIMDEPLNSSSQHSFGQKAKTIIEGARQKILALLNVEDNYSLVFTSSGTEANNLALKGCNNLKVITTAIEHPSVLSVIGEGIIPVNKAGIIDLDILEKIVSSHKDRFLVSIQAANNETGVIQPLKKACEIVHKYGGLIHTDAIQAFGKVEFNAAYLDVDLATISSHKIGGPVGAGALLFKKDISLTPLMKGGGQEFRLRPGTPNIPAIKGFEIASGIAVNSLAEFRKVEVLRDYMEKELQKVANDVIIFGKNSLRLPNTSSIGMPHLNNETQVIHFDMLGFAVSAGAACSSGTTNLPFVQMAMGFDESVARTALRISLSLNSTKNDVNYFINCWKELYYKTRNTEITA